LPWLAQILLEFSSNEDWRIFLHPPLRQSSPCSRGPDKQGNRHRDWKFRSRRNRKELKRRLLENQFFRNRVWVEHLLENITLFQDAIYIANIPIITTIDITTYNVFWVGMSTCFWNDKDFWQKNYIS
jgi:hypothetical protein